MPIVRGIIGQRVGAHEQIALGVDQAQSRCSDRLQLRAAGQKRRSMPRSSQLGGQIAANPARANDRHLHSAHPSLSAPGVSHQIEDLGRRFRDVGSGPEDSRNARVFQEMIVLRRNDPATDHENLTCVGRIQRLDQLGRQRLVPRGLGRDADTCTSLSIASCAASSGV